MYKKIPGNKEYRIDINGNIINLENQLVYTKENKVKIEINRKFTIKEKQWLSLLSFYNTNIENIEIEDITFTKIPNNSLRLRTGYLMLFKKEQKFLKHYILIPNYTRYAISKLDNSVLDTYTNTVIKESITPDGYVSVYIYDDDKCKCRDVKLHRLIALARIPVKDITTHNIVNHIDGNKLNNNISNLEWSNPKHNSEHARRIGLTTDEVSMKIRDRNTGEVKHFKSVSTMSKYLNLPHKLGYNYVNKLPGYLLKSRFEVKYGKDNTPWFYENESIDDSVSGKSIFLIYVTNKETNEVIIFNRVKAMLRKMKFSISKTGIDNIVKELNLKYDNYIITFDKFGVTGPYEVKNILTNTVYIFETMRECSKKINIGNNELSDDISNKRYYVYNEEWTVIPLEQKHNKIIFVNKNKKIKEVLVLNTKTNKETLYSSIREVSRDLGIERKTISYRIKTGKPYKGLLFRTA